MPRRSQSSSTLDPTTAFGFLPSITDGIRRWVRRVIARRAQRLVDRVRGLAPYTSEYVISSDRIEARVERLELVRVTDLRRVRSAVFSADLACLFRRRVPGGLQRVVYLPSAAARQAVCESLHRAGVEVVEIDAASL